MVRVDWPGFGEADRAPIRYRPSLYTRFLAAFAGTRVQVLPTRALALDTEIRFHSASELHAFVADALSPAGAASALPRAVRLADAGYHLRISRDLAAAKSYLRDRYAESPLARFGIVASSRDRDLGGFGIANDWQSTKRIRVGPWSGDAEESAASCRRLEIVVTEFAAQGLELDAVLLAWGTDFVRSGGRWSNAGARGYKRGKTPEDPFQLRLNAYRVLLTRGRDGTVVFVPPLAALDETYDHLVACGFKPLEAPGEPADDWVI